jgi:hypothetical protein
MQITLSPTRGDAPRTLNRSGDIITVDGEPFDFSQIAEGDTLPREAVTGNWLASDVTRTSGVLHFRVVFPHGGGAPTETRFPSPITVTENGPITLPPYDTPEAAP